VAEKAAFAPFVFSSPSSRFSAAEPREIRQANENREKWAKVIQAAKIKAE
jgi:hypothetical protein